MRRPAVRRRHGAVLALLALWAAAAAGLQELTTRVRDWFVMTDELLYERLALSVVRSHSPLPAVHGARVPNVDQLYPLLLSTAIGRGPVPNGLADAHVLNAVVMSSACVPVYLLARRVTGSRPLALVVGLLAICVPWIVLSSFLLTEVAAYPAFVWAMLAFHVALSAPSRRHDVLALLGIALAVLARTQFLVLLLVLPLAAVAVDGRAVLARHRALAWAYGAVLLAAAALLATGHASSALGTYGSTLRGNLLPEDSGRSLLEHLATLALGLAIVPFLAGGAWLCANVVRREPFAVLATVAVLAVAVEATVFDLRFGSGLVRDRYLFYAAPLLLVAFAAWLRERGRIRLSLVVPAAVAVGGFALVGLPVYDKLDADTPVSVLDGALRRSGHSLTGARLTLVAATVVLALVLLHGSALARRRWVAAVLAAATAAALPGEAAYAFVRLFRVDDTAGRPLTQTPAGAGWIDQAVGRSASVTIVPYPTIPGDYWASVSSWWDAEFWNESVVRAAYAGGAYEGTPSTFPRTPLRFDSRTGAASASPTRFVAQSTKETRFAISGRALGETYNVLLLDAARPWRADWLTFGLTDDGWTLPGRVGRIRVFAQPGQRGAVIRTLTLAVRTAPAAATLAFVVRSDRGHWSWSGPNSGTETGEISVCVPPRGYSDVTISSPVVVQTYGDMRNADTFGFERRAGVLLSSIALANELGGPC